MITQNELETLPAFRTERSEIMANLISAHCVADYFLLQTDPNAGDAITNLKLQKLCYYGQAWHVAHTGRPLFSEKIKAWAHGPVIPDLWHRFKDRRWLSLDVSDVKTDPYNDLHVKDQAFLDGVWRSYSPLSGKQLEELTHSEAPWKIAYGDRPLGQACNTEITLDSMREYYRSQLPA